MRSTFPGATFAESDRPVKVSDFGSYSISDLHSKLQEVTCFRLSEQGTEESAEARRKSEEAAEIRQSSARFLRDHSRTVQVTAEEYQSRAALATEAKAMAAEEREAASFAKGRGQKEYACPGRCGSVFFGKGAFLMHCNASKHGCSLEQAEARWKKDRTKYKTPLGWLTGRINSNNY